MRIWLDDSRRPPMAMPPNTWRWATTVGQALKAICEAPVSEMSLDHDLGQPWDGKDLLLVIAATCTTPNPLSKNLAHTVYHVHTDNVSEQVPMVSLIEYILANRIQPKE